MRITDTPLDWQKLRDQRVLVTGGGGFLAAYLIKAILAVSRKYNLNTHVMCMVRKPESAQARLADYLGASDFSLIVHDVSLPVPADVPAANLIIHAASYASPRFYGTAPVDTILPNTAGTQHLLSYATRCGASKFLFFSTSEVYGQSQHREQPMHETDYGYLDPMQVRSCYAESKRLGETLCVSWSQQYQLHTSVVRPFHTYGPGIALDDGRVFADFVANVVANKDIRLNSDGLAQRAFCYVADATIGFLTVLLEGESMQAYNIANPEAEISIRDLATLIAGLFPERGISVEFAVPVDSNTYLKSPVARANPDIRKVRQLGWQPVTGLETGFSRTIQSFI